MKKIRLTVQKYGGTSVADTNKIEKVASHIAACFKNGTGVVAIVSAMGHETDRLISLINKISGDPNLREYDQVLQTGETVTAGLLTIALQKLGVPAISCTAFQMGLMTTSEHSSAKIVKIRDKKRLQKMISSHVLIFAGFQGLSEKNGDITTLGRGGSDATAVAIAAALKADMCEIYTDVDGVYAIDPRIVKNARRFGKISFDQMIRMAAAGAGVLMERCVRIARAHNVPLKVLLSPSIGNSDGGTVVSSAGNPTNIEETLDLTGLAICENIGIVRVNNIRNVPGSARKLFEKTADINIIDVIQGVGKKTATMTILASANDTRTIEKRFSEIPEIKIEHQDALVSLTLVDSQMDNMPGYFFRIARALHEKKVNIEAIGSSGKGIMIAVKIDSLHKSAQALAEEFGLVES